MRPSAFPCGSTAGTLSYYAHYFPALKQDIWGGEFWSDGFSLATVSERVNWKVVEFTIEIKKQAHRYYEPAVWTCQEAIDQGNVCPAMKGTTPLISPGTVMGCLMRRTDCRGTFSSIA